jgi:hypothetical protein
MVVHHIKVDPISPGSQDIANFLAQASKVRRQNRRGNQVICHDEFLWFDVSIN